MSKMVPIFLLIASVCFGQPTTSQDVEQWIKKWSVVMQLEDWQITGRVVQKNELRPKTLGRSTWDAKTKKASILVLSHENYPGKPWKFWMNIREDQELTVIHELTHLKLSPITDDEDKLTEEFIVNDLSRIIYNSQKKK